MCVRVSVCASGRGHGNTRVLKLPRWSWCPHSALRHVSKGFARAAEKSPVFEQSVILVVPRDADLLSVFYCSQFSRGSALPYSDLILIVYDVHTQSLEICMSCSGKCLFSLFCNHCVGVLYSCCFVRILHSPECESCITFRVEDVF